MDSLFDVASAAVNGRTTASADCSAYGAVAEHLAIVELLRREHSVAIPVVDDDGVDLVVNYQLRVQVKNCQRTKLTPVPGYTYSRFAWSSRQLWEKADVFLFHALDDGRSRWWVVPAAVLAGYSTTVSMYSGGKRHKVSRIAQYEDGWGLFDA